MSRVTERYTREGTASARELYRTDLSSADAVTTLETALSPTIRRSLVGRPTLACAVEFTTASNSCTIMACVFDRSSDTDVLIGCQKAVVTADATARRTATGKFISPPVLFDTLGGTHYEIRLFTAAAAAVSLRAWEY